MSGETYAMMYGPTTGDKVRLASEDVAIRLLGRWVQGLEVVMFFKNVEQSIKSLYGLLCL
ncbi:hypothetical protein [Eubacterium sp.]|uniref:hypothetical protein n=1 Tax=Eubacterium sp. TaxID=142586 RepID=UPI002FC5CA63